VGATREPIITMPQTTKVSFTVCYTFVVEEVVRLDITTILSCDGRARSFHRTKGTLVTMLTTSHTRSSEHGSRGAHISRTERRICRPVCRVRRTISPCAGGIIGVEGTKATPSGHVVTYR
jgi:hypothetical protein